jgi:hypothetical protein
MRLIDADALSENLDKRRTYEVMNGRNKVYGKGVRDAMNDVDAAPTIDAIPMEWIEDMLREWHKNKAPFEAIGAVSGMLVMWRKEQEAR